MRTIPYDFPGMTQDESPECSRAMEGKKQFEEAMKLNMKLGPRSEAHKAAVRRRVAATARERERVPASSPGCPCPHP
jgi:hypothetical protein